jgi:hypothetical protein
MGNLKNADFSRHPSINVMNSSLWRKGVQGFQWVIHLMFT